MNYITLIGIFVASFGLTIAFYPSMDGQEKNEKLSDNVESRAVENISGNRSLKTATFAGGCFWCIEAIYDDRGGVKEAVSGYTEGSRMNASYNRVSTGKTDHREAVKVKYYPSVVSYKELVDDFWRNIDPTDAGGQFSDRGYQYTTAIYYHNQRQKQIAEESKANLSESDRFDESIVTEIKKNTSFYVAEDYHQNYSERNTYRYNAYKTASGRSGFIEKFWD